jgi:hypothetical protein
MTKDEALKLALSCIRQSTEYKLGRALFVEAAEDVEFALAAPAQEPVTRSIKGMLQPDAYLPNGTLNPKYTQPAAPVQEPNYKVTVVDDQHPNGVPLEQWGRPAPVQEPVAWIEHHKGGDNLVWDDPSGKRTPLYTTPPAAQRTWVGLTDEEAQWIYDNGRTPSGMMEMVEAKLKERNNG